jgi:myo-inositol 2-dehydrogenase/D-chiro-inositol 1-dehydrogenase
MVRFDMSVRIAVLGAGRIGQVHARAIAGHDAAVLTAIADPVAAAANAIAEQYGCDVRTIDEIAVSDDVDGVIICTPTDTHADLIEQFARSGKAIFCEKPIDLSVDRVRACLDVVNQTKAVLMVGFNRRFDPHFAALKDAINKGDIGNSEMAVITSRDPGAPPIDYIKRSGGIFRDMTIHDFDMAVFLMDEMPITVQASGSVLVDPAIGEAGDYDSASVIMTMASGKQVNISNSRRATYGYDQRIEVHGSKGMVAAENQRPVSIELATASGYARPPLHDFFMTRYIDAYANEITAFVDCIVNGAQPSPNGQDGLNALRIADAALLSAQTGKAVQL